MPIMKKREKREKKEKKILQISVGIYQGNINKTVKNIRIESSIIEEKPPDFLVFPEYFGIFQNGRFDLQEGIKNSELLLEFYEELSTKIDSIIIGGSVLELKGKKNVYNTSYIFYNGLKLGKYRKKRLFYEEKRYVKPYYDKYVIIEGKNIWFSVLLSNDILDIGDFSGVGVYKPDIVFIPSLHIHNPDDTITQKIREEDMLFYKKARKMLISIVRCCGIGMFCKNRVDGRSLVVSPDKVLFRADVKDEKKEMYRIIRLGIQK